MRFTQWLGNYNYTIILKKLEDDIIDTRVTQLSLES